MAVSKWDKLALWGCTAIVVAVAIFIVLSETVFALTDPDVIAINLVNRYDDVAVDGDVFFLVEYNLQYAVLPAENVAQGWQGRLVDAGGSGLLAVVAPFAGHDIPDLGYSTGAFGFYFSEEPTVTGMLRIYLNGNPSLSPSPVGLYTESITQRDASDLEADLRAMAIRFEDIWDVDLLSPIDSGDQHYTDDGEHYFVSALPNLRVLAPDLFVLQSTIPEVPDREFDTTYTDAKQSIFDGTPMAIGFEHGALALNTSEATVRLISALIIALVIAYVVMKWMSGTEFATTFAIWAAYLVLVAGFLVGMVTAPVLGVLTIACILTSSVAYFLSKTSA